MSKDHIETQRYKIGADAAEAIRQCALREEAYREALQAIVKESGIRHFDGEPTGTIQTMAYIAHVALSKIQL